MMETPRIYLITPVLQEAGDFVKKLQEAVTAGDVACVLLRMAARDEGDAKKLVRACADIAQPQGAALLVEADAGADGPTLVMRANADGVHFSRGLHPSLEDTLTRLQPDRIVGIGGLKSRDDAMAAGEAGVDYLMFGEPKADNYVPELAATVERIEWWANIFNVPCVGYAHRLADIAPLCAAGAEFVALGDAIWNDPRGAAEAMKEAQMLLQVETSP
ncbi:MAG: thiamine phosphate synthase [Hyphomicrobiales bacterium]|nr:thiamine phosphate synthase [Hyphomicrobiales bacterium]MDE2115490.1 thiamine phosphate synthase [Hyphomicrobiales bacterium]